MEFKQPKTISEIGCNHKGDISIAKEMIKTSKECGADVAKFQKRDNKTLLPPDQYNAPHPNPHNSYGDSYGAHREFLEFTIEEHHELKNYCDQIGIIYSTSVWDVVSAKEVITIAPELIKVPSAMNTNFDMLTLLRDEYQGEVHISTGMTTKHEEKEVIDFFLETNQAKRIVLYSCTSGYPVDPEDVCLLEIKRLHDLFSDQVKAIGFSGHHLGIALDIAAYMLGAEWIERHFTHNRAWKGTDHAASLEPQGLSKLIRDLNETHQALSYKSDDLLPVEIVQRDKLKYKK